MRPLGGPSGAPPRRLGFILWSASPRCHRGPSPFQCPAPLPFLGRPGLRQQSLRTVGPGPAPRLPLSIRPSVTLPVRPGFLFMNRRRGRALPPHLTWWWSRSATPACALSSSFARPVLPHFHPSGRTSTPSAIPHSGLIRLLHAVLSHRRGRPWSPPSGARCLPHRGIPRPDPWARPRRYYSPDLLALFLYLHRPIPGPGLFDRWCCSQHPLTSSR